MVDRVEPLPPPLTREAKPEAPVTPEPPVDDCLPDVAWEVERPPPPLPNARDEVGIVVIDVPGGDPNTLFDARVSVLCHPGCLAVFSLDDVRLLNPGPGFVRDVPVPVPVEPVDPMLRRVILDSFVRSSGRRIINPALPPKLEGPPEVAVISLSRLPRPGRVRVPS